MKKNRDRRNDVRNDLHNATMLQEFQRTDPSGMPKVAMILGGTADCRVHVTIDQSLPREELLSMLLSIGEALTAESMKKGIETIIPIDPTTVDGKPS